MILLFIVLNFALSWYNSYKVGSSWSEAESVGGSLYVSTWIGYIFSISGFSFVYWYILVKILPYVIPYLIESEEALTPSDFAYLAHAANLIGYALICFGLCNLIFTIYFNSFLHYGRFGYFDSVYYHRYYVIGSHHHYHHSSFSSGRGVSGGGFGRSGKKSSSSSSGKKDGLGLLVFLALIVAILGGFLTARLIKNNADEEHEMYDWLGIDRWPKRHQEAVG